MGTAEEIEMRTQQHATRCHQGDAGEGRVTDDPFVSGSGSKHVASVGPGTQRHTKDAAVQATETGQDNDCTYPAAGLEGMAQFKMSGNLEALLNEQNTKILHYMDLEGKRVSEIHQLQGELNESRMACQELERKCHTFQNRLYGLGTPSAHPQDPTLHVRGWKWSDEVCL